MKIGRVLFAFVLCPVAIFTAVPARAGYDVIVASQVEFDTQGNVAVATGLWGWVIAGDETLTGDDFSNAVFTGSVDNPNVTYDNDYQEFMNIGHYAPVAPGHVVGLRAVGWNDAAFDPLLQAGDVLSLTDYASFWALSLAWPASYVGTTTFTGSVTIGGETVSYSTFVVLGDFAAGPEVYAKVVAGQRLSSVPVVPVPGAILLGGIGLSLVGWMRRRGTL